jgi:hypothetical protein
MSLDWRDDDAPPEARGVVGVGHAARRLLEALPEDAAARGLEVAASVELLVVTGALADLPWVDGAIYVAPRPEAPGLWLPTTERPREPLDLVLRAAQARPAPLPLLMLRAPAMLVPLARLRAASPTLLAQVAARWHAVA